MAARRPLNTMRQTRAGARSTASPPSAEGRNQLLRVLPRPVLARLERHFEPVQLQRREVLFRAHEPLRAVYFPEDAVVSLVSTLESGQALEVGLVGRDGVVGTAIFPGISMMSCDGVVQVPGLAQRIDADVIRRELMAQEAAYATMCRYAHLLLVRGMHMSVCNMFHAAEQRCIRWLLTVGDLHDGNDLPLTQELMATMLGVHRPTVSLVLQSLRRAGLIGERRGHILIHDRARLEAACCECYRAMRDEQQRLLGY